MRQSLGYQHSSPRHEDNPIMPEIDRSAYESGILIRVIAYSQFPHHQEFFKAAEIGKTALKMFPAPGTGVRGGEGGTYLCRFLRAYALKKRHK